MRIVAERAGFEVVKETGCAFYLVKRPVRFNLRRFPGISYEIIYTLRKVGSPKSYATFDGDKGLERVATNLFT